jgi:hypothetical protein
VNDGVDAERQIGIIAHEVVRHRAGKPVAPAVGVEPQQVVAICLGFADPQFADQTAVGEWIMHCAFPLLVKRRISLIVQPGILRCNMSSAMATR